MPESITAERRAQIKRELASELDSKLKDWSDEAEGVYSSDELDEPAIADLLNEVLGELSVERYF